MRWTMRRCDGAMRWGDAMGRCDGAMLPSPHSIASSSIASPHRPSHRLIVHRIVSSSIASPHRPSHRPIASPHRASHRCIAHRIASSSIALDIIRNASVSLLGHHTSGGGCRVWHSSDTQDHTDLFVLLVCDAA